MKNNRVANMHKWNDRARATVTVDDKMKDSAQDDFFIRFVVPGF